MTTSLQQFFPGFAQHMGKLDVEDVTAPLNELEIQNLERRLKVELPPSYKRFLKCTRGFTALGGSVQLGPQHPFFHEFDELSQLSLEQQNIIKQKQAHGRLLATACYVLLNSLWKQTVPESFEQWLNEFHNYEAFQEE